LATENKVKSGPDVLQTLDNCSQYCIVQVGGQPACESQRGGLFRHDGSVGQNIAALPLHYTEGKNGREMADESTALY
jgi:hypothetical protein